MVMSKLESISKEAVTVWPPSVCLAGLQKTTKHLSLQVVSVLRFKLGIP